MVAQYCVFGYEHRSDHKSSCGKDAKQQRQAIDLLDGNRQFGWCHITRVAHRWWNLAPQMRES